MGGMQRWFPNGIIPPEEFEDESDERNLKQEMIYDDAELFFRGLQSDSSDSGSCGGSNTTSDQSCEGYNQTYSETFRQKHYAWTTATPYARAGIKIASKKAFGRIVLTDTLGLSDPITGVIMALGIMAKVNKKVIDFEMNIPWLGWLDWYFTLMGWIDDGIIDVFDGLGDAFWWLLRHSPIGYAFEAIKHNKEERNSGAVEYYGGSCWTQLHDNGWASPGTAIKVFWGDGVVNYENPSAVYGLNNGAVEYFDGSTETWSQLQSTGWNSAVVSMDAQLDLARNGIYTLQVVVGLLNGAIFYYSADFNSGTVPGTGGWQQLHDNQWDTSANEIAVVFPEANNAGYEDLRIVVGLGNGAVEYFTGSSASNAAWTQLHDSGYASPITAMCTNFGSESVQPQVVIGLYNGAIEYYDGSSWSQTQTSRCNSDDCNGLGIAQMECYFPEYGADPAIAVSLWDTTTLLFAGKSLPQDTSLTVHDNAWGNGNNANALCVDFDNFEELYNNGQWPPTEYDQLSVAEANIQLVQGFTDGAVVAFNGPAGNVWATIQPTNGTQVAGMQCQFSKLPDTYSLQVVIGYSNGEVLTYPESEDCLQFTTVQSEGWDNQLAVFGVRWMPNYQPPHILGGLQPEEFSYSWDAFGSGTDDP